MVMVTLMDAAIGAAPLFTPGRRSTTHCDWPDAILFNAAMNGTCPLGRWKSAGQAELRAATQGCREGEADAEKHSSVARSRS